MELDLKIGFTDVARVANEVRDALLMEQDVRYAAKRIIGEIVKRAIRFVNQFLNLNFY